MSNYADAKDLLSRSESVPEMINIYYLGALYQQTGEFEDAVNYYLKF